MYISNRTFLTLKSFAERLGIDGDTIRRRHRHGAIQSRRRNGDYRVTLKELHRFACSPDCWILVHPRDIIDPDVRQAALDAWRAVGSPQWYTTHGLAQHYDAVQGTIKGWRMRGWLAGHWILQGGASGRGVYWLIWAGDLPEPPERRPSSHGQTNIRNAAAQRAPVIDAVLACGGPPGKGAGAFWPQIAAQLGCPVATVRTRWRKAVLYGEVPHA